MDKTQLKIEDTNLCNFGTEIETQVKLAAAKTERAWDNVGKAEGIEIWRIEKFNVVAWPKDHYGSFFNGDSYIVLHTFKKGDMLCWNAHMWVGLYTTMDEAGTAAYKIVELDTLFGREMTLYREVQGSESELFHTYFPVIHILEGGIESGFKKVPIELYEPRLLLVRGKKNVRVSQVRLSNQSLNSGDVFILDSGEIIYVWIGSKANPFEKFKGTSVAETLKEDRLGKSKVVTLEEKDDNEHFWGLLGGKVEVNEKGIIEEIKHETLLFRLSDSNGKLELTEVARGCNVKKSLLDTNHVFILDFGFEVVAWHGKNCSVTEKQNSLHFAQTYAHNLGKTHISVCSVNEGKESPLFENSF